LFFHTASIPKNATHCQLVLALFYALNTRYNTVHDTYTQEKNMSNNKSGFEIRADLLNQAQGIIEGNFQREVDAIYAHNDTFPNDKKPLPLREITGEEVIRTARQLNEFVTEK